MGVPAASGAVVVQESGSPTRERKAPSRAHIVPVGQGILRVKGIGFVPRERVRITLTGQTHKTRIVHATARGTFFVRFPTVSSCDNVVVRAVGASGRHDSFDLRDYRCAAP